MTSPVPRAITASPLPRPLTHPARDPRCDARTAPWRRRCRTRCPGVTVHVRVPTAVAYAWSVDKLEHEIDENLQLLRAKVVVERLVVLLLHGLDCNRGQSQPDEDRIHQQAR
jgi:hypothetical protein